MILAPILWKLAPYAAAGAACVALATFAPVIGFNAQRHRLETARDQYRTEAAAWHRNADGWRASFTKAEDLRRDETTQARQAVEADAAQCSARVAEARRSAKAIRAIVERPVKVDGGGCPVRAVISVDEMRDALGAR